MGETFSLLCFNQILFLNVCLSAGHTLWEGLAEFGTIVVPRIVFRSTVVVTGSPPSSNHYIRMQGRWWISLWMKMVRWCLFPFCLFFFFVHFFKEKHFPPISVFKLSAYNIGTFSCCFVVIMCKVLKFLTLLWNITTSFNSCLWLPDEEPKWWKAAKHLMPHTVWQIWAIFRQYLGKCIH